MKIKVVWLQPPMYPVNHLFFNFLSEKVDLTVYQIGDHPNFRIEDENFADRNYEFRLINNLTYEKRKQNSPYFVKYLKQDKPDIVVSVAFWLPSLYLAIFKCFLHFKLVIATDATSFTESKNGFLKNILRKYISYKTELFIAASDYSAKYLKSLFSRSIVVISRQTIDTANWIERSRSFKNKTKLRKEFGLPLNKTILLGVGRFEKRKNWEKLIEVIKILDDSFYLVIVGEGELKMSYYDKIKSYDLGNKVSILPWMDNLDMIKIYNLSDMFVFPSLRDQFGFVVPEALSCGLPVICSELVGSVDFIKENENGFIINPNSDVIDKVKIISSNLSMFSMNAIEEAQKHSLENRASEHHMIFKTLFSHNGRKK